MKLKRLFLGVGALVSLGALASCSNETKLVLNYLDANNEAQEVSLEKSDKPEDVLNALKVLAKADAKVIDDINTVKLNMKLDWNSTMDNQKYNMYMNMDLFYDLTQYNVFSINMKMDMDALSQKESINMNAYCDGNYGYIDMYDGKESAKIKTSVSKISSLMGGSYYELADVFTQNYYNRELEQFFDAIYPKTNSSTSTYEFICENEQAILEKIQEKNVTLSSVTSDTIYISFDLKGKDIFNGYQNFGAGYDVTNNTLFGENDYMTLTYGFSTNTYFVSYVKMDLSNAPVMVNSLLSRTNMSVSKFAIEVECKPNEGSLNLPNDLSSYTSYYGF